jgi:hypothetical protein
LTETFIACHRLSEPVEGQIQNDGDVVYWNARLFKNLCVTEGKRFFPEVITVKNAGKKAG